MGAIRLQNKTVLIDQEECVECGVCQRLNVCSEKAIRQVDEIPYPRVLRSIFSDPTTRHESTGVSGRGTEEMKTNDVTNNFTKKDIGFSVELGRPGVGAYLRDLDKVTRKVTELGVRFAKDNPVVSLISNKDTGALKPDILGEKVLSAIVEFSVDKKLAIPVFSKLAKYLNSDLETVATVSVISRADENGNSDFFSELEAHNIHPYPNGKVNLGMAKI